METPARYFIGIDRGGSSVRFCFLDGKGRHVKTVKRPSGPIEDFPNQIKQVLDAENASPLSRAVIATRGAISKRWKRDFLMNALESRLARVEVIPDLAAAYFTALKPGEGLLLLAGTGAAAFAVSASGTHELAGGLGPEKGDEGSGFWTGKTWLAATRGAVINDFSQPSVRKTASNARKAIDMARRGDPVAQGVVELARLRLAETAAELAARLRPGGTMHVTWGGSIMDNDYFRAGVISKLRITMPRLRFTGKKPRCAPALAAARKAMEGEKNAASRNLH